MSDEENNIECPQRESFADRCHILIDEDGCFAKCHQVFDPQPSYDVSRSARCLFVPLECQVRAFLTMHVCRTVCLTPVLTMILKHRLKTMWAHTRRNVKILVSSFARRGDRKQIQVITRDIASFAIYPNCHGFSNMKALSKAHVKFPVQMSKNKT